MTPREAAAILGFGKSTTVTDLIRIGKLKATKISTKPGDWGYSRWGYRYEISKSQLRRYRQKFPEIGIGRPRKTLGKPND